MNRSIPFSVLAVVILAGCSRDSGVTSPAALSADVQAGHRTSRHYVLTDLGIGLPGAPGLVPLSVNDRGDVVGNASVGILSSLPSCSPATCGTPQGWIFQHGALRQLPPLGTDVQSIADAINNAGVVSGGSVGAVEEAVLWNPDGSITNLGTGIEGPGGSAEAIGISNSGKVVGISADVTGSNNVPTAFHADGHASAPCGPNTQGQLIAVNDEGFAAGYEFTPQFVAITCPPLAVVESKNGSFAWDVNNERETVGRVFFGPGHFHGFAYRDGTTTDLGTLSPGNPASVSAAFGINDRGAIVGFTADANAIPSPPVNPRAFLYRHGRMVDLNTLLPAETRARWTLVIAMHISNKGYIVGSAFVGGYPNGVEHGFLLTPKHDDENDDENNQSGEP